MMQGLPLLMALLLAGPTQRHDGDRTARVMEATSPDGRYRAQVRPLRAVFCGTNGMGSTDNGIHFMDVFEAGTGRLVGGMAGGLFDADPMHGTAYFGSPKFSPDGSRVYVVARDTTCETGTWRDAPRVYWIYSHDSPVRAPQFVAEGRLIAILRTGPHAGGLLIQQRGEARRGDPVMLFGPEGGRILTVPGSERTGTTAVAPWLKARRWRAY